MTALCSMHMHMTHTTYTTVEDERARLAVQLSTRLRTNGRLSRWRGIPILKISTSILILYKINIAQQLFMTDVSVWVGGRNRQREHARACDVPADVGR